MTVINSQLDSQPVDSQLVDSQLVDSQLQTLADGISQAIEWVEVSRQQAHRLDIEADEVMLKLRRSRNKAANLLQAASRRCAIAFYGMQQAGKSYLISELAGDEGRLETTLGSETFDFLRDIHPAKQSAHFVTRFTYHQREQHADYPVRVELLDEAALIQLVATAFSQEPHPVDNAYLLDERSISQHLASVSLHRQPQIVAGLSGDQTLALWDALAHQQSLATQSKRQHLLATAFWPTAVELAPYLNIDQRGQLFSLLWDGRRELTAAYCQYAHVLQQFSGAQTLLAPLNALFDDATPQAYGLMSAQPSHLQIDVCPLHDGVLAPVRQLSLDELMLLTREVTIPLAASATHQALSHVDFLDMPPIGDQISILSSDQANLSSSLLAAKRIVLLDRYSEEQQMNWLLVCNAVGKRDDVKTLGAALKKWVLLTQGEQAALRKNRKPGLIWAITPYDREKGFDAAVQRYVGNPGDTWGAMTALDGSSLQRMASWLVENAQERVKSTRLSEQLHELQRELVENQLGIWCLPAAGEEIERKQHIAKTLLKALQARTGVHGELLERLLPERGIIRRLYLQQYRPELSAHKSLASVDAQPFGIGVEIDLLADLDEDIFTSDGVDTQRLSEKKPVEEKSLEEKFADNVLRYWINHLRNLPENAPLIHLLGVSKASIEMLMEELITASIRLDIGNKLTATLTQSAPTVDPQSHADSQVSRVLTVLGDFVAWLGFLQIPEEERPESRINRGYKIFVQPPKPAVNWAEGQRLTKLTLAPINNTAFYIYDWLVGLNRIIVLNAGYSAATEIAPEQQTKLEAIIKKIRPVA
ncbi:virulence factor SrfC family protein [Rouxiella sp. Mn2063]|uniref:virulence factor SrfC family protein n=1 Tax=Rouxiella sp. Mn2063 TaxID=3395262 RepID=UPI003BECE1D7